MDLFKKFKDLVDESLLCRSYKEMSVAQRVLCLIAVAPFIALYVVMLLAYAAIAVVYRFACDILEYVHSFIKNERTGVRHATEFFIYILVFPLVFAMRLINAVIAVVLMIVHFFVSMIGYVATFGGIKFRPFLFDDVDRTEKGSFAKHCKSALVVFIVLGLVFLTFACLFKHVTYEFYQVYKEYTIRDTVVSEMKRLKDEDSISVEMWNDFVDKHMAEGVSSENYLEYEDLFLRGFAHRSWDVAKEESFGRFVEISYALFIATYALFVMIYVSAYSNAIKRRKAAMAVEVDVELPETVKEPEVVEELEAVEEPEVVEELEVVQVSEEQAAAEEANGDPEVTEEA